MSSEPALDVNVYLRRGEDFELDVAFRAPPGITVLFGPSGCGKSTVFATLAGMLKPTRGRITLGDDTWFDADRRVWIAPEKRGIAYVFQSFALFPHLTALDNVEFGIDRKLARRERRERAHEMLKRMHVDHLARRRPRGFSGGESQRVALARAFARSPRLLLLDEPFSALDRKLRHDFADDVRAYVEDARVPLLLVTHAVDEALAMSNQAVLLVRGHVEQIGDPHQLLEIAQRLPQPGGPDVQAEENEPEHPAPTH
jgi:molybdate transport system ATP-binding protein